MLRLTKRGLVRREADVVGDAGWRDLVMADHWWLVAVAVLGS